MTRLSTPRVDIGRQALGVREFVLERHVKIGGESRQSDIIAIKKGVQGEVDRGDRILDVDLYVSMINYARRTESVIDRGQVIEERCMHESI